MNNCQAAYATIPHPPIPGRSFHSTGFASADEASYTVNFYSYEFGPLNVKEGYIIDSREFVPAVPVVQRAYRRCVAFATGTSIMVREATTQSLKKGGRHPVSLRIRISKISSDGEFE